MWPFKKPKLKSWKEVRPHILEIETECGRRIRVENGVWDVETGKSLMPRYDAFATIFDGRFGGVVRQAYWQYDDQKSQEKGK